MNLLWLHPFGLVAWTPSDGGSSSGDFYRRRFSFLAPVVTALDSLPSDILVFLLCVNGVRDKIGLS
jgi:hypothetical protein